MTDKTLSPKHAKALQAIEPQAYDAAVEALITHECRKARVEHPKGTFDNAKRWYPSAEEEATGTFKDIRSPSRHWPNSFNQAARTLAHCEKLAGAEHEHVLAVKRVAKEWGVDLTERKEAEQALKAAYSQAQERGQAKDLPAETVKAEPAKPEPVKAPEPAKPADSRVAFPSMDDADAYVAAKRSRTADLGETNTPRLAVSR